MIDRHPSPSHSLNIDEQASQWALRVDRGLTSAEQDRFLEWVAADPRHGPQFAQYRRDWNRLLLLAQWRPEHSAHPNPDLLAPPLRKRPGVWKWTVGTLAAAAAVIFAFTLGGPRADQKVNADVPSLAGTSTTNSPVEQILPDGTKIKLNGATRVEVDYLPHRRHVTLNQGEAHFTVAKDPTRPFIVTARGVDVQAIGTTFNVRVDHAAVEVLVTEGLVRVDSPPGLPSSPVATAPSFPRRQVPALEPHQRAVISLAAMQEPPRIATLTPSEIARVLAWQQPWQHQLLTFKAVPLREIVAELNRRNEVKLFIEDPELAALPITASFRSDNVEGLVSLLEAGFGAKTRTVR